MIIDRAKMKNPYLKAYVDKFNYVEGKEIKNTDYMFWIDNKHSEYRKLIGYPENCELSKEMIPAFVEWLRTSEEKVR